MMSSNQAVEFALTEAQQVIHNSGARFKLVAAGRRFGKTYLAAIECVLQAMATHNYFGDPLDSSSEVIYFGVDREQAKRNVWNILKEVARPFTTHVHENNCVLTVNNGITDCRIRLMGMDRPSSGRGSKVRYAVLDEFADFPEDVWEEIIRPALMDSRGCALFIGTPKGKNHFYDLFCFASSEEDAEWAAFNYESSDNPTLNEQELAKVAADYARGSPELHAQEIRGRFIARGGALFAMDDFNIVDKEPKQGSYFIAVDLAGFSRSSGKRTAEMRRLDETSIAVCKAHPTVAADGKADTGWWIRDIIHGQWDVNETAAKIIKAYIKYRPVSVGIEKGALMNAVLGPLNSLQAANKTFMNVIPLKHGNTAKYDRVQWALQGRSKRGLVTLNPGKWNDTFLEQAVDFPSKLSHDDLLDAVAYFDQLCGTWANMSTFKTQQRYVPNCDITAYGA
jgi:phage terminase large subunit-like protein